MQPKMTIEDAARILGKSQTAIYDQLIEQNLAFTSTDNLFHFAHATAKQLFQFSFQPKVVVFQILKGGTGKTSLAFEFAIRANLYGAKVLCIDLDQQANLTQAFNQTAEDLPVMVDSLAEGYSLLDSFIPVFEGLDLLPSRIENAMLDEIIRKKQFALEKVYREPLKILKKSYDLIIVDCPPSLGQSVAAAALAADLLLAPVTPEKFSLSGLQATCQSIMELQTEFDIEIPINILMNKFDAEIPQSSEILTWLQQEPYYQNKLLDTLVRLSPAFPKAALQNLSLFESLWASPAKDDVDEFTRRILGIERVNPEDRSKARISDSFGYNLSAKPAIAFC